ncbi:MAG: hypothetical protein HYV97_06370 [Bdellovibrio sp.]|nr:hypothetical protein [Bdellovibrio sp.]
MSTKPLPITVLILALSCAACERKIVVERDITTPPVMQNNMQEEVNPDNASEGKPQLPPGHPSIDSNTSTTSSGALKVTVRPGEIKRIDGGITVQECFTQKATIGGKSVRVRGKVVKYNAGIMGKNWIHIQDGTGGPGENDLITTTKQEVSLSQVIVVSGVLQYNKNIGSGYVFPAIIEDGVITIE